MKIIKNKTGAAGIPETATGAEYDKVDGELLTPMQLGARWGLHPESVRRMLRRGEVRSTIIGRRRLIPRTEISLIENRGLVSPRRDGGGGQ
jgi:hypothetical protein